MNTSLSSTDIKTLQRLGYSNQRTPPKRKRAKPEGNNKGFFNKVWDKNPIIHAVAWAFCWFLIGYIANETSLYTHSIEFLYNHTLESKLEVESKVKSL